jgi:hypothetical protein
LSSKQAKNTTMAVAAFRNSDKQPLDLKKKISTI